MVNIVDKYNSYQNNDALRIKDVIRHTREKDVCVVYRIRCTKNPNVVLLRLKKFYRKYLNIQVGAFENRLIAGYYLRNEYYKVAIIIDLGTKTAKSCMLYDSVEDYTYRGRPFDVFFNVRGLLTEMFK